MADFKIGRIRFKWKGPWVTGTSYTKDDIVQYGGKSYVCLIGHVAATDFNSDLENINLQTVPNTPNPRWELWIDGYEWKSTWQQDTLYDLGDLVRYGSVVYRCIDSHTSQLTLEADQSKWIVYSAADEWKYNWTSSVRYKVNDIVKYRGIVYRCTVGHLSASNNLLGLEADQSKWEIVSRSDSWQEEWQTNFRYRLDDTVRYGGNVFRCVNPHISSPLESAGLESQIVPNYTNLVSAWQQVLDGNTGAPLYNFLTEVLDNGFARGDLDESGDITITDRNFVTSFLGNSQLNTAAYRRFYKNVILEMVQDHPTYSVYLATSWEMVYYQVEHKFNWTTAVRYKPNDVVKFGSSLWKCIVPHTSSTFPSDQTYWEIYLGGLEFDNQWNSAIEYQFGDVVRYGGYSYVYIANVPAANLPPNLNLVSTWNLLTTNYKLLGDWLSSTTYYPGDVVRYNGFLYRCIAESVTTTPTGNANWEIVVSGRQWRNRWVSGTVYRVGDIATYASSSYIALIDHTATTGNSPIASLNTTWDYYVQGDLNNPLFIQGDLIVEGTSVEERFPIGTFGQSLISNGTTLTWRDFGVIAKVYYVAPTGIDDPSYGTTLNAPWKTVRYACSRVTGPATIFIKTGIYSEVLPIVVPANVALVGDELRGTVIQPAGSVISNTDVPYSLAALARLEDIISNVVQNIAVTKTASNPLNQNVTVTPAGSPTAGSAAASLLDTAQLFINFSINAIGSNPVMTGTNTITVDSGRLQAALILEANKEFLAEEAVAFINTTYPGYIYNQAACKRDVREYIDALKYDITYIGNYKTLMAARYYVNAVQGSITKDMFYVRNGTGIRNMTLQGLTGTLGSPNTFGTRRPTAGAYVSLDAGWGPNDTSVWITTKSPYVQNVTTFGTACVGLKIDGSLHNGGNDSVVANDFTQVLSDGIGIWCRGLARTELVSVFSYYGHIGYLAELGGKIRATNGNSSYGTYGCVAEGVDTSETPITGSIDNRNQQAQIAEVFAGQAGDQLLIVEYANCGQNYTSASISFSGSGVNAAANMSTFRNSAIYEVRITDTLNTNQAGGANYLLRRNQAQAGNSTSITLASNDQNTQANYLGMRVIITSGTGVGQYGYVDTYDNITKVMTVRKESDDTQGWDHVVLGSPIVGALDTTTTYSIEPRVTFSAPGGGGIRARGRAIVAAGKISEIRIWEPGQNYTTATVTLTDPNNTTEAELLCRIGNGVLGQPTFTNRGTGYRTSSTVATITGDGFADIFQLGRFLTVQGISLLPGPGANLQISGLNPVLSSTIYRIVNVTSLSGSKVRLQISPTIDRFESPAHGVSISIRENYSQVRLTGHDFLDIGTGNFTSTNYPNVNEFTKQPENEVAQFGGGRIFYTSTDQDGNFRAGEFFAVEQATGTVTISADFFELTGLEELAIGGLGLGGTNTVIREFSTDNTFAADSNSVVPTQKAIKAYVARRISGGGADAQTSILVAGTVRVGPQQIGSTISQGININRKVNITRGVDGSMMALSYFSQGFASSDLSDDYYDA